MEPKRQARILISRYHVHMIGWLENKTLQQFFSHSFSVQFTLLSIMEGLSD